MTASRAPAEPTVREFEATVESVDGREVTLSETYFYPESGGQPADRGDLGGHAVADVRAVDGEVVHVLESAPDLSAGDRVAGTIDHAFRTYCMRAHTASHVLYGAARRLFDELGYAGFDIGTEKVRVDLETGRELGDEELVELERLANRAVWDSLRVEWTELPVEEARAADDVAFNTKTEEGVMADADTVRVVTVDGWDRAACGGTHVSTTAEIGHVEVLDRSNPGEGRTRVEFAVGPTGVERNAAVHTAALEAARAAGTGVDELPDAVASLAAERDRLEEELRERSEALLAARIAELDRVARDGATWAVGTVDGFGPNEVGEPLQAAVGEGADEPDVAAVVGRDGAPFVVVASTGAVDAGDVVDDLTAAFGGGGGGGPTFAQGGGLDAEPAEVVEELRA